MKKEFVFTQADIGLFDILTEVYKGIQLLGDDKVREVYEAVMSVMGEKHGFDPETVELISNDKPNHILAIPI